MLKLDLLPFPHEEVAYAPPFRAEKILKVHQTKVKIINWLSSNEQNGWFSKVSCLEAAGGNSIPYVASDWSRAALMTCQSS